MSRPVDVLATLDDAALRVEAIHGPTAVYALREARAAVAELLEAAKDAELMFNTVRGCYERNPGNFAVAMRELEGESLPRLRAAIAKFGSAA